MDSGGREAEPEEAHILRGEEEWVVRVAGRSGSGRAMELSAPLLFLTFSRGSDAEAPAREAVVVGRRLGDLHEEALLEALATARPFAIDWQRGELFTGTRRGKGRK